MTGHDVSQLRVDLDVGADFLSALAADQVPHMSGSFLDHLAGVADLLVGWDCPPDTCLAGLFHAVYGTEAFPRPLVDSASDSDRDRVRAVIGERAEQLAWLFERVGRREFFGDVDAEPPAIVDRRTGDLIPLTHAEHRALCHLFAANWLEQLPRSAKKGTRPVVAQYSRLVPHLSPPAAAAVSAVHRSSRAHDAVARARRRLRQLGSRR